MRLPINTIIAGKHFHRDHYRRATYFLHASLIVSICLLVGIFLLLTLRTEVDFYASNGITTPVLLESLSAPRSTQLLLEPEQTVVEDAQEKVVGE